MLDALGPEGYLINIAGGSVVDQDALVELLLEGGTVLTPVPETTS